MPPGKRSRKGKQSGRGGAMAASAAAFAGGAGATAGAASSLGGGAAVPHHQPPSKDEMELILTSEKRRGVYHCDYCHSDISQLPRIRCAVCPEFDLCLDCFTTTDHAAASARLRATLETHTALQESANRPDPTHPTVGLALTPTTGAIHHDDTHGYRVCDSTRYPLFPNPRNVSIKEAAVPTAAATSTSATGTTSAAATEENNVKLPAINEEVPMNVDEGEKDATKLGDESTAKDTPGEQEAVADDGDDDDPMDIDDDDKPPLEDQKEEATAVKEDTAKTSKAAKATTTTTLDQQPSAAKAAKKSTSTTSSEDGGAAVVVAAISAAATSDLVHTMDDPKAMWTVEEDLRLLEGIKTHGLGNWVEISESVSGQGSTGKTPRRCMERYMDDFLGRYGHILPQYTLIMEDSADGGESNGGGDAAAAGSDKASVESGSEAPPPPEEGTRTSKRRAALMRNSSFASNQQSLASRKKFRVVPTESIEGYDKIWPNPYLPKCEDRTVAIGQEVGRDQACKAEQAYVKTIASVQSQEEVEVIRKEWAETKLNKPGGPTVLPPRPDDVAAMSGAELAGFMPRRGDFDVEVENDAEQAVADMEFLPGESEEDKKLKLQVLAIYNSRLHERERRKEFVLSRKLWDYRKIHEAHQKLPRDERDLVHRMRLFERFHTPAEHQKFIDDLLKAKRLRKEIAKLQMYRRMGIRTLAEAEKYELDKNRRQFHKMVHSPKEADGSKADSASGAATGELGRYASAGEESSSLWKQYQYRTTDRKARKSINRGASTEMEEAKLPASGRASMPTKPTEDGKKAAISAVSNDANPTSRSNGSLLSPQEVALCEKLNLNHDQYMTIRKTLIFESLQKGLLDKEGANSSKRALVKLDIEQRDGIIDFFLTAGWVSTKMGEICRGRSNQVVK